MQFRAEVSGFSSFTITDKIAAKEAVNETLSEPNKQGPEQKVVDNDKF